MEPEQSTTGAPIQSGENESNRPLSRFHYHYHQCNDCALPIGDPWRAGNGTAECSRKPARPVRSSSARWRISKRTSPTFCHTHIGFIITVIRSLQSFIVQIPFFFFFSLFSAHSIKLVDPIDPLSTIGKQIWASNQVICFVTGSVNVSPTLRIPKLKQSHRVLPIRF